MFFFLVLDNILEERDVQGWGAFHHACAHGELEICVLLKEITEEQGDGEGLDLFQKTGDGLTGLHLACLNGCVEVVFWLLESMEIEGEVNDFLK